jgi:tetratricopeptide (TPR) repeat protein
MRKAYAPVVFLFFAGFGNAQIYAPGSGFGIVSPLDRNIDPEQGRTITVARLRHKLIRKAVVAFRRAAKFANSGAWQQGALELQKAVAIDPEFSEAHGNLGANYIRLGRLEDAAAELRRAIRLDPATGTHHANLAVALSMMRRPNDAELEARSAVAMDPTNFKAQYVLGCLLANRPDRRTDAIPHLTYAARFLPEGHEALAEVYRASGEPERAQAEMERYRKMESKRAPRP